MRRATLILCLSAVVVFALASPGYALRVGWNVDIHMNKHFYPVGDPNRGGVNDAANDFHIWGVLESGLPDGSNPPTLSGNVNFQTTGPNGVPPWKMMPVEEGGAVFNTFNSQIGNPVTRPLPPGSPFPDPNFPPAAPFYYFEGSWSNPNHPLPFCTWMHFGLDFDETCHNIGYWLSAVWTKDGVDPAGNPIYGFEVRDGYDGTSPIPSEPQRITIQNASGVETEVQTMDLMILSNAEGLAFPLADLNTDFFDTHQDWNARWVHVPTSLLPTHLLNGGGGIDSFFDVFLDAVPGLGVLGPSEVLLSRQSSFYSEEGTDPMFWQYEIHEAHTPEPATLLSLLAGWGLLAARRRK